VKRIPAKGQSAGVIDVNVNEIDGQNGEVDSVVALIPALRAFARSFCRNPNDADDLVQETLVKAIANIDKYEEGTRLKSWLFTIMRNTFYTRIRVAKREAPGDADCVASQPIVLATQEWTLRGQEVEAAIERLSPSHREVLVLIGMQGVSYEEAAEICGCAIGTVKSRLNRARGAVLEMLGERSAGALVESSEWLAGEASPSGRVSPR
jgi:RNA polymerase sigma-70 factor (ECF subfamily)